MVAIGSKDMQVSSGIWENTASVATDFIVFPTVVVSIKSVIVARIIVIAIILNVKHFRKAQHLLDACIDAVA